MWSQAGEEVRDEATLWRYVSRQDHFTISITDMIPNKVMSDLNVLCSGVLNLIFL